MALAVAKAREVLGVLPERIEILTSMNIYKNGMGVGIPGTTMVGLPIASAMGAIGGDSSKELEVLSGVSPEQVEQAQQYLKENRLSIKIKQDCDKLYVEVHCYAATDHSCVIIEKSHCNFVYISKNGTVLLEHRSEKEEEVEHTDYPLTLKEIYDFSTREALGKIEFIYEKAMYNRRLAQYGIEHKSGMGIGAQLYSWMEDKKIADDLTNYAVALTAAASDARMSGALLPAMSNSGSGNQGITAMTPVLAVGEKLGASHEQIVRALMLSNLVSIHIKQGFGRLSAACGCVVASTGAACGVCYLLGGKYSHVENVVKNMVGNLAGMVCDGAKLGCALKVATGTSSAIQSAILAYNGVVVPGSNGIVEDDVENTIRNLGRLVNAGMEKADPVILDIMLHKQQ